jgi:hypothetical protein
MSGKSRCVVPSLTRRLFLDDTIVSSAVRSMMTGALLARRYVYIITFSPSSFTFLLCHSNSITCILWSGAMDEAITDLFNNILVRLRRIPFFVYSTCAHFGGVSNSISSSLSSFQSNVVSNVSSSVLFSQVVISTPMSLSTASSSGEFDH